MSGPLFSFLCIMFYRLIFLFLSFAFTTGLHAQTKSYLCLNPATEMSIDGNLTEWQNTPKTSDFIDITGKPNLLPYLNTNVMMMWDSNYLYVAAELEEPHLWATVSERDRVIYLDNDFEIFIDPDGDTHNYVEIEVNALGTVWDLFLARPYRDGTTPLNSYNIDGLLCEIKLKGSLNDPSDTDEGWTIEIAIPWSALVDLTPAKRKPYPNEYWRINFSRVQREFDIKDNQYIKKKDLSNGKNLPENNWVWSPQGKVDMHMPEKWGFVFFSQNVVAKDLPIPTIPALECDIRKILRDYYFAQREWKTEKGRYAFDLDSLYVPSEVGECPGKFSMSSSGLQYTIEFDDTLAQKWIINDQGRIWKGKHIKAYIWMHGDNSLSDSAWAVRFKELANYGIDGVLLGGSNELLKRVIPLANEEDIEIHAWRWMLNCNHKEVIESHPEWYSVSREGFSCLEKQVYVAYYKWLCPSREDVREYLYSIVEETIQIDGLSGFHMDYIRHPDVILPVALWPTYGLVQDHEMPEYDFCYCDVCRTKFEEKHGYDPLDLEQPDLDTAWRQYRYDIVTDLVNGIETKLNYHHLSAAVFPSPDIARTLVRQDWDKWQSVNIVFPMVYHSFYNEGLEWIGETTREGVFALNHKTKLYTGLYIPALSPEELNLAIKIALDAGASGISLFDYNAMTDEHWDVLKIRMKSIQ